MELTVQNVFASAFNDANEFIIGNLPQEVQDAIKSLTGKAIRENGFMKVGDVITISDAMKAKTFIEKSFLAAAEDDDDVENDDDDADGRQAKVWLKTNKSVTEAQRGDDIPFLIRDVVVRRSRADKERKTIYGVGIRGIDTNGKGVKFTLNLQYFSTVMGLTKTATPTTEEIVDWSKTNLKNKWAVAGTLISRKGETGYFTLTTTPLEKAALDAAGKENVMRNNAGMYGFVHQMDGIRYNLAGLCDKEESDEYQALLDAVNQANILRKQEAEKGKGVQEGLAFAMQAKLSQLQQMLENKLISKQEYVTMRTNLLANGM